MKLPIFFISLLVTGPLAQASFNPKDLWKNIRTYQANFTQEVTSKTMPGSSPDLTHGVFYLKRPSRLRWETQTDSGFPDLQILANDELKAIRKNSRGTVLVDIYPNVKKQPSAKVLNFLMGQDEITKYYQVKVLGEDEAKVKLELVSKASPKETYIAEIDKRGYFLLSLSTETDESSVVMKFEHPKLNTALAAGLFEYKIKPGDVVHRQ